MTNSIYQINKGINKPLEFKGLKAQYIAYLGVGLVVLLLLFAILYLIGINMYVCLLTVISGGSVLFTWVSKYSRKYGRYGLMKKAAARRLPASLMIHSRKIFIQIEHQKETNG